MDINSSWLTPNQYSRPQERMEQIRGIVVHWVANPKTSAQNNVDYLESRKHGGKGYGSAHEFIDLDGSIVKCIPADEMAYAVGSNTYTSDALNQLSSYPNDCTYSIECTHVDMSGQMTNETYNTLVQRCKNLCDQFGLDPLKDLWLHKEVVGWKDCHRWFVNNPDEWKKFKNRVNETEKKDNTDEGEEIMTPSSQALSDSFREFLIRMSDEEKHGDSAINDIWVKRFDNKTLSNADAIALYTIAVTRGMNV